jgi:predicted RecA/RadA family phage recombinase
MGYQTIALFYSVLFLSRNILMKNYVQDGKTISFTPTAAVASGEAVLLATLLVVAIGAIAVDTEGTGVTEGVFELPKKSTDVLAVGAAVYWDDTANEITSLATGNTLAGKVWAAAANPSTSVWVKINA